MTPTSGRTNVRSRGQSVYARRRREGVLSPEEAIKATAILNILSAEWSEVQPGERLRQRAERLIMVHPLRTADAFQLSAALIYGRRPIKRGLPFPPKNSKISAQYACVAS
jgi:hypothetical protein